MTDAPAPRLQAHRQALVMQPRPLAPFKPQTPSDGSYIPFFRSFILGKTVELDKVTALPDKELDLLEIETLAALDEARHNHEQVEDKQSEDGHSEFRRIKTAGYFQAAIKLARSARKTI